LSELGVSALSLSPEEFGTYLGAETEKWAEVVKFADLKPQ
jgi:tripartite-type tricarboxylate transporter receptor subunit TctC